MAADLASVDLDPLSRLLRACAPDATLVVRDAGGVEVGRCGAGDARVDELLAGHVPGAPCHPAGALVAERELVDDVSGVFGSVVVACVDCGDEERFAALVTALAGCVSQLALQSGELDDMARELAVRYEELNLLYTLDERRAGYDPAVGHEALARMADDCSAFLDVGLCCLYAPAENLDLCISGDHAGELRGLWRELRARLLTFAAERNAATVVNSDAERRAAGFDGELPGKLLLVPLRNADGRVCGLLCTLNRPERADFSNSDRKLMEVLADQASRIIQRSYDGVTGLLNRHGFGRRATERLLASGDGPAALLYLNIDSIRMVNDSAGRRAGDAMLRRVATLLSGWIPAGGLLGHLGGDEFVMLFTPCASLQQARRHAGILQAALAADGFRFEGKRFDISACAGIAEGGASQGLAFLLSAAEAACRVAKGYGRGQLRVYDPQDDRYLDRQRQAAWGPRIIEALGSGGFVLFAQPIVPIDGDEETRHFEVLVRLSQPDGRIAAPGSFLSAAERYGLMPRLDRLVLSMSVGFMRERARQAPDDDFVLAINVSGQSLADGEYLSHVLDIVTASGLPYRRFCFEITETAAIADFDAAVRFIDAVRVRGSRVALDDFGSGLSSFGYLRRLPVDYLKIDGQIVRAVVEDPINAVMVESIHRIGCVMGIRTIAEFVENAATMEALRTIGVDFAQGYGIARPRPIAEAVMTAHAGPRAVPAAALP